jgi:hypothetical protein
MDEFTDDEIRFLRKIISMRQAQLEIDVVRTTGETRRRARRDMLTAEAAYAKVQSEINDRLLGDDAA